MVGDVVELDVNDGSLCGLEDCRESEDRAGDGGRRFEPWYVDRLSGDDVEDSESASMLALLRLSRGVRGSSGSSGGASSAGWDGRSWKIGRFRWTAAWINGDQANRVMIGEIDSEGHVESIRGLAMSLRIARTGNVVSFRSRGNRRKIASNPLEIQYRRTRHLDAQILHALQALSPALQNNLALGLAVDLPQRVLLAHVEHRPPPRRAHLLPPPHVHSPGGLVALGEAASGGGTADEHVQGYPRGSPAAPVEHRVGFGLGVPGVGLEDVRPLGEVGYV